MKFVLIEWQEMFPGKTKFCFLPLEKQNLKSHPSRYLAFINAKEMSCTEIHKQLQNKMASLPPKDQFPMEISSNAWSVNLEEMD